MFRIVEGGGVTSPKGFIANGLYCGIKRSKRPDLALLYSQVPAVAAAAFTTNRFAASPVKASKVHIHSRLHQAIIVNSGNANCANGKRGDLDAVRMAHAAAKNIALGDEAVLVASTGIIGQRLPIDKIEKALPRLLEGLSGRGGSKFAKAILTTDRVSKECCVKVRLDNSVVTIGGAAKGVGMIYPNLKVVPHATMLCFITTDADMGKGVLSEALREAADDSFNMISVDGDMSTNDTVFILANGLAGNRRIVRAKRDFGIFKDALRHLTKVLAKKIVLDGEGATKMIEVNIKGAESCDDARRIARRITTSNLLKACVYGRDPNWGRVLAACGSSSVQFNPDKVDVYLGDTKVLSRGAGVKGVNRKGLRNELNKKDVYITVALNSGRASAKAWTCDLSLEYVRINSAYGT